MTGIILDLANTAKIAAGNTFGTAVSATGGLATVDLIDSVANMSSALITSSAVAGAGTASVKIQESADDSSWSDVSGAVFDTISAANAQQLLSFVHTKRYVRGYATITGTSVTFQLTFLANRRDAPANKGGWVNETGATG